MSDTLTRAANAAAEALGMSVEVVRVGVYQVPRIEICGPIDSPENGQPLDGGIDFHKDTSALAYLKGLETGARLMRERYADVVGNARALLNTVEASNGDEVVPLAIGLCIIAIREALANLED